jgi:hypothetical protein
MHVAICHRKLQVLHKAHQNWSIKNVILAKIHLHSNQVSLRKVITASALHNYMDVTASALHNYMDAFHL